MEMQLNNNKIVKFDTKNYNLFKNVTWSAHKPYNTWYGNSRQGYMHRLIKPEYSNIDHIDGVGLNNLESNLRDGSNGTNNKNWTLNSNNTTGITGVSFYKASKHWRARIKLQGKERCKYFKTKEEAIHQRLAWNEEFVFTPRVQIFN